MCVISCCNKFFCREIWVSCAKYEYERYANFNTCRTVFQNALRFNHDNPQLWIEYFKFELNFVTKLINRRKVMDLINEREQEMDMLNEKNENLLVQDQKTGIRYFCSKITKKEDFSCCSKGS